ncbi:hypothetical protein BVX97_03320 [bacterium E08(2017)]|nr:hypothetical protein BVX97_03320 [bacterium E08(2017)]
MLSAAEQHSCHSCAAGDIEIGFSIGYVNLDEDQEDHEEAEGEDHEEEHDTSDDGIGIHVHVGKRLGTEGILSHISLGVAAETIVAEHEHYALMAFASVYPWRGLVLSVGPGVEWAEHEGEMESAYSTHLEAAYVFDVGSWHIGPVLDFSKTNDSEHFTAGIHFGIHL